MAEADEGVHKRQLPGMVQFQAWDAFAIRQNRGFGQLAQLPAINESLQNVLLDVVIVVDDRRQILAQLREILDGFFAPIVVYIVGRRFGSQQYVIADILLDEAVTVVTADNGVGQVHVLNDGLELSAVLFGDSPTEDHGDLVGLADAPIGIQKPFAHPIQCCTSAEDEIVTLLHLSKKQSMLTACVLAFPFGEERGKRS